MPKDHIQNLERILQMLGVGADPISRHGHHIRKKDTAAPAGYAGRRLSVLHGIGDQLMEKSTEILASTVTWPGSTAISSITAPAPASLLEACFAGIGAKHIDILLYPVV